VVSASERASEAANLGSFAPVRSSSVNEYGDETLAAPDAGQILATNRPPVDGLSNKKALMQGFSMGGTGLEPVTPSLSNWFSDRDDLRVSPIFPAQRAFHSSSFKYHLDAPVIVCASFVRRGFIARAGFEQTSTTSYRLIELRQL